MGERFIFVNQTKREYITGDDMSSDSPLGSWCSCRQFGLLFYLLHKSQTNEEPYMEGVNVGEYTGHWAGDQICILTEHDNSQRYQATLADYHNIAEEFLADFKEFYEAIDWLSL